MKRLRQVTDATHETYEYRLVRRRGHRAMTLSVHSDGAITLTVPKWVLVRAADAYVRDNSTWLREHTNALPHAQRQERATCERDHYETYKEHARSVVHGWLRRLAPQVTPHAPHGRVSIRRNRTRWGSCSSTGALSFDYRILFLPEHLQEYLIVHELCHLEEMNHSPRFWQLVAAHIPDYTHRKRELHMLQRDNLGQ
jgi:predicted metal-dependent hydrolase